MPLHHVSLPTGPAGFDAMRTFYLALLEPLGYAVYKEDPPKWCGMGPKYGGPDLWLHCGGDDLKPFAGDVEKRSGGVHLAFEVGSKKAVDEFYRNAL